MFENIDIEKVKEELRNHSTNYKENFAKIEKFIETETPVSYTHLTLPTKA